MIKKDYPVKNREHQIWIDGYIAGLIEYAWWKDGTQYVGSCGKTLDQAIERAKSLFSPKNREDK